MQHGIPLNISILELTAEKLKGIRPVSSLEAFQAKTHNFHPDGLFSSEIFGRTGDPLRMRRVSFITLKTEIAHPNLWEVLMSLKNYYVKIASGAMYAVFDKTLKEFVPAGPGEGETGYDFFMRHWKDIAFAKTESLQRGDKVQIVEKFKDIPLYGHVVVIPAGIRDMQINSNGQVAENEINKLYRKLLNAANLVTPSLAKSDPESLNRSRYNMQLTFNQLYELLQSLLAGKKKLIQGKVASRNVTDSGRNVITSSVPNFSDLDHPDLVGVNDLALGLHQFIMSVPMSSATMVRRDFSNQVFPPNSNTALLINKQTLKREAVEVPYSVVDTWTSPEGLRTVFKELAHDDFCHKPIEIEGRWLALIYMGKDGAFKLVDDISSLPNGRSAKDLKPATPLELFFILLRKLTVLHPLFTSRYPTTGEGSIFPCFASLKTTTKSLSLVELDGNWLKDQKLATHNFPIRDEHVFRSMSPASVHLSAAGADFDGDMMNAIATQTREAAQEVRDLLLSPHYYVGTRGKPVYSMATDTMEFVFTNFIKDPV